MAKQQETAVAKQQETAVAKRPVSDPLGMEIDEEADGQLDLNEIMAEPLKPVLH